MSLRVSVIIPAFNNQSDLSACVRNVASQHYPSSLLELIVVDNGSAPALELPDPLPFDARIVPCLKPGSYAARNAGARAASGDVLAFTDADCLPSSDWISSGINALRSSVSDCVIGGEVEFIAPPVATATALYQMAVGFQQEENIREKGFSVTANLFCSRTTFQQVGPFNEDLLSGGDLEWSQRARLTGIPVHYVPEAVVKTMPRASLAGAIVQARRVAAGRYHLIRHSTVVVANKDLAPHRHAFEALKWILRHPRLTFMERLKVLAIAIAIRGASTLELARLRLGSPPERR